MYIEIIWGCLTSFGDEIPTGGKIIYIKKGTDPHLYTFPVEDSPISSHIYTYKLIFHYFVIPSDAMAVECFRSIGS